MRILCIYLPWERSEDRGVQQNSSIRHLCAGIISLYWGILKTTVSSKPGCQQPLLLLSWAGNIIPDQKGGNGNENDGHNDPKQNPLEPPTIKGRPLCDADLLDTLGDVFVDLRGLVLNVGHGDAILNNERVEVLKELRKFRNRLFHLVHIILLRSDSTQRRRGLARSRVISAQLSREERRQQTGLMEDTT